MKRTLIALAFYVLTTCGVFSQKSLLKSGPMMGYVDYREACVWVQTTTAAKVKARYWRHKDTVYETAEVITNATSFNTAKLIFGEIEPGSQYTYQVWADGKNTGTSSGFTFKVPSLWKWRTDPPTFRFAIGSCHYSNEPVYDRPGNGYGYSDNRIFNTIVAQKPELMLWLGDNIYLREPDWNTKTGIYKRYIHMRTNPAIKNLLSYCPNYAIWDDHDFGPNDADRGFWNKTTTLQAFKDFWANPGYGVNGEPGITTYFEWADAEFFLLDDRYNRTPNDSKDDNKTILGQNQKQWLLDNLLRSKATFKFVAVGGQFLNTMAKYENFANYAKERSEIIDFIQANKIKNVVFMTGDRHHAEISKLQGDTTKPSIYDVTSSPLTSGAGNGAQQEINDLRVAGSLVTGKRNFAIMEITGLRTKRTLTVFFYDKEGAELFKYEIPAE